jgi:YVTN family beta-propeller protein
MVGTRSIALVLCVGAALSGLALRGTQANPLVFTADEGGGTLTVIDPAKGTSRQIRLPIVPHDVHLGADGRMLLAVGLARVPPEDGRAARGQLLLFDLACAPKLVGSVEVGTDPAHVVTSEDGRTAYVTDSEQHELVAVDLARHAVRYRSHVGRGPYGLRLSPDHRVIAIANAGDGSVSLVSVATGQESRRIQVGRRPMQVAFTPDGHRLLVSLNAENVLAIVDVATARVVAKVAVGRAPQQVAVARDDATAVVANRGWTGRPDDRVSLVDLHEPSVRHVRSGAGAHGVAIDGRTAYVTNMYADTLSLLDLDKGDVTLTLATGRGPSGVAVRPARTEGFSCPVD